VESRRAGSGHRRQGPGTYSEAELDEVDRYERDASRYGLQLLHDLRVRDLDAWLTEFSTSDVAISSTSTDRGEGGSPRLLAQRHALLEPLPIPPFTRSGSSCGSSGVVI